MEELCVQLDSRVKETSNLAYRKILETLTNSKDSKLVNRLYDYYLSTNSVKIIRILVTLKEPHHDYLLEKLNDSISAPIKNKWHETKVQALTLLGHIVRTQPKWLYKVAEHTLMKSVLKLLKTEDEILPLISALLLLIVLIPMIPYSMGRLLPSIFEVFSRLASWHFLPSKSIKDQLTHLQIALYALFLRLYGMFPRHFISYLRSEYKDKNRPVFFHTIKPMLETVKLNPSLVIIPKDIETSTDRWKTVSVYDTVVECERYSLDVPDTYCAHEQCQVAPGFRSRSGTTTNTGLEPSYFHSLRSIGISISRSEGHDYFTPNLKFKTVNLTPTLEFQTVEPQTEFTHDENVVPVAGCSPPEAAIEATPETTPVLPGEFSSKSTSVTKQSPDSLPFDSPYQTICVTESDPFVFTELSEKADTSQLSQKQEHHQSSCSDVTDIETSAEKNTDNAGSDKDIKSEMSENKSLSSESENVNIPPAPPLPHPNFTLRLRTSSEEQLLVSIEQSIIDEENASPSPPLPSPKKKKQLSDLMEENEDVTSELLEEDRSSPCSAGGLHMPNSKSMMDFAKHVQRLRHHSQCNPEDLEHDVEKEVISAVVNIRADKCREPKKVKRSTSCPDIDNSESVKDLSSNEVTYNESDEDTSNRSEFESFSKKKETVEIDTQTENFWPMPYEHLFLGIFPSLGTSQQRQLSQESGAGSSFEKTTPTSIYEVLDKYVETAISSVESSSEAQVKSQLELLRQQMLFERHRREIHARKNRNFFKDVKNTLVLEEHNSALKDQIKLQQSDIDALSRQLKGMRIKQERQIRNYLERINGLEAQCQTMESDNKELNVIQDGLNTKLETTSEELFNAMLEKERMDAELDDALTECKVAKEQVLLSEKSRNELEMLRKQIIIMGEIHLKSLERLNEISSMKEMDEEIFSLEQSRSHELKNVTNQLRELSSMYEMYRERTQELETEVRRLERNVLKEKHRLRRVGEEYESRLDTHESKYKTQLAICRSYEQEIIRLNSLLERKVADFNLSDDSDDDSLYEKSPIPTIEEKRFKLFKELPFAVPDYIGFYRHKFNTQPPDVSMLDTSSSSVQTRRALYLQIESESDQSMDIDPDRLIIDEAEQPISNILESTSESVEPIERDSEAPSKSDPSEPLLSEASELPIDAKPGQARESKSEQSIESECEQPVKSKPAKPIKPKFDKPTKTKTTQPTRQSFDQPIESDSGEAIEAKPGSDQPFKSESTESQQSESGQPIERKSDISIRPKSARPIKSDKPPTKTKSEKRPVNPESGQATEAPSDRQIEPSEPEQATQRPARRSSS